MSEIGSGQNMSDIDAMKWERWHGLIGREVIIIVKTDYGCEVQHWRPDGVAPDSQYDTPQEAAARACQLLKLTEPVKPQDWPEIAQIGGDGRAARKAS